MSINMCQHHAFQVNVSRKGVLCAPDSSNFLGTTCVKEILVDNKHLLIVIYSSCHPYERVSFEIGYAVVFSLAKMAFLNKMVANSTSNYMVSGAITD